ncbi:hypothetical protein LPTSP1_21820 [Leptospira johnsonii]|uniref:Uncharacterized protein n=1 Tax=Leptospira johnsonii TaxID=1917820 RepID=A0A2P2D3L4_9LEPT|nr:hypothetical protein LPTSP1_21820 [Leptospira johnsonii]
MNYKLEQYMLLARVWKKLDKILAETASTSIVFAFGKNKRPQLWQTLLGTWTVKISIMTHPS